MRQEADDVQRRLDQGRSIAEAIRTNADELARQRQQMRQEIQQNLADADRKTARDKAGAGTVSQTGFSRAVAER